MIGIDTAKCNQVLDSYPLLSTLLQGGMLSKKSCRNLLHLSREDFDDKVYYPLLVANSITGVSSSTFRAKKELVELILERSKGTHEESSSTM